MGHVTEIRQEPSNLGRNARQTQHSQAGLDRTVERLGPSYTSSPLQQLGYLMKGWIAAKQFVSTQSRESHLETLARSRAAHEVGVQTVNGRLVHAPEKIIEKVLEFITADSHSRMVTAQ